MASKTERERESRPADSGRLAVARMFLAATWIAAGITMLIAVSLEPAVTLLICLDDTITTERLGAVLKTVVLPVQLIQHGIQHLRTIVITSQKQYHKRQNH